MRDALRSTRALFGAWRAVLAINADVHFFGPHRLETNPPRLTRDGVDVDLTSAQFAKNVRVAGVTLRPEKLLVHSFQPLASLTAVSRHVPSTDPNAPT